MKDVPPSAREWTQIIRGEFLEIPGLRLTRDQIQQLWGLRPEACATVLDVLLSERFLRRTPDGGYVRVSPGIRPRAAQSESTHSELAVYGH